MIVCHIHFFFEVKYAIFSFRYNTRGLNQQLPLGTHCAAKFHVCGHLFRFVLEILYGIDYSIIHSKSKMQREFCASVMVKIMLIYCGFLFLCFLLERANGSTHVLSSLAARSQRFWKSRSSDRDFLRICKVETILWQAVRTDRLMACKLWCVA
jgi:hypothetical protein